MDEIDQLRQELALARAWGVSLYHRAYPVKSPPVVVPAVRENRTARDACGARAPETPWRDVLVVAIDTETTGTDPATDRVIEIAFVTGSASWSTLINPGVPIPPSATAVHGISDADVAGAPTFAEAWEEARRRSLLAGHPLAYHAPFDCSMIAAELVRAGLVEEAQQLADVEWLDGCVLVKDVDKFKKGKKLTQACARRGIALEAHRALGDATATLELWNRISGDWCRGHSRLVDVLSRTKLRRAEQDREFAEWQRKQNGRAA